MLHVFSVENKKSRIYLFVGTLALGQEAALSAGGVLGKLRTPPWWGSHPASAWGNEQPKVDCVTSNG